MDHRKWKEFKLHKVKSDLSCIGEIVKRHLSVSSNHILHLGNHYEAYKSLLSSDGWVSPWGQIFGEAACVWKHGYYLLPSDWIQY